MLALTSAKESRPVYNPHNLLSVCLRFLSFAFFDPLFLSFSLILSSFVSSQPLRYFNRNYQISRMWEEYRPSYLPASVLAGTAAGAAAKRVCRDKPGQAHQN